MSSGRDYDDPSALAALYSASLNAKGGSHIKGLLAVAKAARVEALTEAMATVEEHEGRYLAYDEIEAAMVATRES